MRPRARISASARVALVATLPRSTPRWTMVWAIWGRIPLMMHSAPIRRAAATVFRRCWATSVSTVGTPVMSMIAIEAPEQALHHHLGPVAVERADERHRQHPLPQRDHRGRELEQVTPLALDHVLARALVDLGGEEAELVEEPGGGPRLAAEPFAVGAVLLAEAGEERLLEREDEGRGLGRRGALAGARRGGAGQPVAHLPHRGGA